MPLCFEILKNVTRLLDATGKPELSLSILAFIIDNPDSSYFINEEAIRIAQTIRSNLSDEMSEQEIEELEAKGREMDLTQIVDEAISLLESVQ